MSKKLEKLHIYMKMMKRIDPNGCWDEVVEMIKNEESNAFNEIDYAVQVLENWMSEAGNECCSIYIEMIERFKRLRKEF